MQDPIGSYRILYKILLGSYRILHKILYDPIGSYTRSYGIYRILYKILYDLYEVLKPVVGS